MDNSDKSAYPQPLPNTGVSPNEAYEMIEETKGLSKRERFAMAAMQGCLAMGCECQGSDERLAETAVAKADALLRQLEETE